MKEEQNDQEEERGSWKREFNEKRAMSVKEQSGSNVIHTIPSLVPQIPRSLLLFRSEKGNFLCPSFSAVTARGRSFFSLRNDISFGS
jgi:hypothetical protein